MQCQESQEAETIKTSVHKDKRVQLAQPPLSFAVGSRDSPGQGLGAHLAAGLCPLGSPGEGRRCLALAAQHPDIAELTSSPGFQPTFSELVSWQAGPEWTQSSRLSDSKSRAVSFYQGGQQQREAGCQTLMQREILSSKSF